MTISHTEFWLCHIEGNTTYALDFPPRRTRAESCDDLATVTDRLMTLDIERDHDVRTGDGWLSVVAPDSEYTIMVVEVPMIGAV